MSCISVSSNLDSFRDGWDVVVQLLLCGVLPAGPESIVKYIKLNFLYFVINNKLGFDGVLSMTAILIFETK